MAKKNKQKKNSANQPTTTIDPVVTMWRERLAQEKSIRKDFRNFCTRIEQIYTGKQSPYSNNTEEDASFNINILWINSEILKAALYSRNPSPDVRRRYKDSVDRLKIKRAPQEQQQELLKEETERIELYNDLGKQISILMERALAYVQDTQDYFGNAEDAVSSFIKFAAGQVRIRYNPYISEGPAKRFEVKKKEDGSFYRDFEEGEEETEIDLMAVQGSDEEGFYIESDEEKEENLEHEELVTEWVPINNFRWETNAEWEDVMWCVIEHYMTYEELVDEFGEEVASKIPLTFTNEGDYVEQAKRKRQESKPTKALIYECFDKREKKVQVFPKDYHSLLKDESDPYQLEGFYPFPKPMFGTMGDDNINPVPDYMYYQDQHTELNTISYRINRLLEVIKYRGFYDGALDKIIDIENQGDGEFKALSNFAELAAMGGGTLNLNNFIATMPIAEAAALLDKLYIYRDQTIKTIHEITGISDIARGSSAASETYGAQQLKAQYTNLRLQPKTKEVERFFRDCKRIEAEFLAEQFEDETLEGMTGMEITEDMSEILTSDLLRSYIIDIETDSTVVMDSSMEQRERTEAVQAMTGILNQVLPLVQIGLLPADLAGQFVLFGLKGFKGARELEDKVQEMMDMQAPQGGQQGQPGQQGQGQQEQKDPAAEIEMAIKEQQLRKTKGEADGIDLENDAASSGIVSLIERLANGAQGAGPGEA